MLVPRLKNDGKALLHLNSLQKKMKFDIEEKISKGQYTFEEIDCAVCKSKESVLVGEKDRYGFYYSVKLCKSCGLLYTSPRMTQTSYNEFYDLEYRNLYMGKEKKADDFVAYQYGRAQGIYKYLEEKGFINKSEMFVLEVGCGAGGILKYFKDQGHKIKGIDLGSEYVNHGKSTYGLDLEQNQLKDLKLDKKPDIIIYSHVLEHVLDINEELEILQKHCHENTIIYIEVPGIKAIHEQYKRDILYYFQNAHTFHFSLKSLENLLNKNGFKLETGTDHVRSIFTVGTPEKDFQNDFTNVSDYIKKQEKSRYLYAISPKGFSSNTKAFILRTLDNLGLREPLKKLLGRS